MRSVGQLLVFLVAAEVMLIVAAARGVVELARRMTGRLGDLWRQDQPPLAEVISIHRYAERLGR
jgi:uncharacterized membrane-anchored protein